MWERKKDSLYRFGKRTKDWKKVKWMKDDDFICLGYIANTNNMTSLILAKLDSEDNYVLMGHVTLGVSLGRLKAHGFDVVPCPFSNVPAGQENAVWISPLVCTVEYMPSTKEGMRQLVFNGIREDKTVKECRVGE